MADLLWAKFYWTDWLSDIGIRRCSLEARGLWMDMLCIAAQHDPIGYVAVKGQACTAEDIARICGASPGVVTKLLAELERNDVFSRDRTGKIYNRRMINDAKKRAIGRTSGSTGGNPKLKGGYSHAGYVYLFGPRLDGAYKIGISKDPKGRLKKVRAQYPGQDIAIISMWQVANMGATEASLHSEFASKSVGEWFFLDAVDIRNIKRKFETLKGETAPRDQRPETRDQKPEEKDSPSLLVDLPQTDDVSRAIELYNLTAKEIGGVINQVQTKARRAAVNARLRSCGGLSGWEFALAKVRSSAFLRGEIASNGRPFRLSLKFLCQEESFSRLMEGYYDDRKKPGAVAGGKANTLATAQQDLRDRLAGYSQGAADD
jgi:hypothetical protein